MVYCEQPSLKSLGSLPAKTKIQRRNDEKFYQKKCPLALHRGFVRDWFDSDKYVCSAGLHTTDDNNFADTETLSSGYSGCADK